ncbi:glycogen synthase [Actinopolymorpha rutila]|uniref:Starch synthase n=1 Tax=Actinopolymorpha rutila TaxID=446787 RepID=A0A852Z9K0_9ACTN|nr:glycogen synthase [Actinopolymorpha rutila]NYH88885.1 starch synthase [Actinopolymorpha rutila]
MRVAMLTREFPPQVYGGAGVHVDYLSQALRALVDLDVHCLGVPRDGAVAHSEDDPRLAGANPALRIFAANLEMAAGVERAQVVHSHTWYANLAGHLAKLLYGIPHVVTAHSLEPRRPWKEEQLGGGYRLSSWAERSAYESADAIIAVSAAMRADVLDCYPGVDPGLVRVIPNGIDTVQYAPDRRTDVVDRLGIDPGRPSVAFVGRITRQKGVPHLLRAAADFDPKAQLVLLAGAPDTPELAAESAAAVDRLRAERDGVVWVQEMLPREDVIQVLTHATVFCCPSIYEPQGIVNLEAMACETAVVASAVGGIPEVVQDCRTGLLVDYDEADPVTFERGLAEKVNTLVADPDRAAAMGLAGRARAVEDYGWDALARRTAEVYAALIG